MGLSASIREFEALFKKLQPQLVRYAYTILRDVEVAREAVQDMFIKIWQKREELELNDELKAYLYRATRNHCLNILKRRKLDTVPLDERLLAMPAEDRHEEVRKRERLAQVYREIEKLPPKAREIFLMSRMEGLSHKEIAEILDISPKTVENQIGISLRKIRSGVK